MRQLLSSAGTPLAVHELGESGRPVLLCHATGFHGAVWEPLAKALPSGLRPWAIDFRGHGASIVPPDHPLDWHGFCDDVLSAVDGLDLPSGEIVGVGHSMGGAALVLAEEARPGTFAGLWLFEPIVPPLGLLPRVRPRRRPSVPTRWPTRRPGDEATSRPLMQPWPTSPRSARSTTCEPTRSTPTCATASSP